MVIRPLGPRPVTYERGDVDEAARQLELVHRLFAGSTRALVAEHVPSPCRRALDLACGPGLTTTLLHEVSGAELTAGLDLLASFIGIARRRHRAEGVTFVVHDVTSMPLPHAPADVILCRFALSHLVAPRETVAAWTTQLAPGGRLLIEEVDRIETDVPSFHEYLSLSEDLAARSGADGAVGDVVASLEGADGVSRQARMRPVPVSPADAAAIYLSGLDAASPRLAARIGERRAADLREGLERAAGDGRGRITWYIHQVAFTRPPAS